MKSPANGVGLLPTDFFIPCECPKLPISVRLMDLDSATAARTVGAHWKVTLMADGIAVVAGAYGWLFAQKACSNVRKLVLLACQSDVLVHLPGERVKRAALLLDLDSNCGEFERTWRQDIESHIRALRLESIDGRLT